MAEITSAEFEKMRLRLDKLDKDFKEIAKQFNSIQTSLDTIYQDRDLLTDIVNDIHKVRELIIKSDEHNESLSKDVVETVEKKSDEVKTEVLLSSDDMHNGVTQKIIKGVHKKFMNEKIHPKRRWYARINPLRLLKKSSTVIVEAV